MIINETESFVVFEDVPVQFCKMLNQIPYRLIWFEMVIKADTVFESGSAIAIPDKTSYIADFDVDNILDLDEVENDEDTEIKFNLYFLKED